jgi:hypothetical protein
VSRFSRSRFSVSRFRSSFFGLEVSSLSRDKSTGTWSFQLVGKEDEGLWMEVDRRRFVEGAYSSTYMAKGGRRGDKAQEDKGKGVVKEASSSHLHAFTKAEIEAWEAHNKFLENCSKESQWEVDQVEEMVKLKHKQTSNEEIWEEVRGWLHDPLYSCTRETKFFKTMELYWHVKAMVAQHWRNAWWTQNKILYTIEIFQGKFELMCHLAYGIKFKVSKASSNQVQESPLSKA